MDTVVKEVAQVSTTVVPEIGPGSQMHQLNKRAAAAGVKHGQTAVLFVEGAEVVKPFNFGARRAPEEKVPDHELRFCNATIRVAGLEGVGDNAALPSGKDARISSPPLPGVGAYNMVIKVHTNGVWNMEVQSAVRRDQLVAAR